MLLRVLPGGQDIENISPGIGVETVYLLKRLDMLLKGLSRKPNVVMKKVRARVLSRTCGAGTRVPPLFCRRSLELVMICLTCCLSCPVRDARRLATV